MTATSTSTSTGVSFRGRRSSRVDPAHGIVEPSAGISSRRCVSFPEVSSGVWTRPPTEYMPGRNATASSVTFDMSYPHSSKSGVPPVAPRQRQRSQPQPAPLQTHPSTAPLITPPQNSYRTSYQGGPGTPESALTDPSTHPSAPTATQRGSVVGHHRTLSNVHQHQHAVHSAQFAFPRHLGSPIPEENVQQSAYVSPSVMTTISPHAPVYQYLTPPDLVPTPSQTFSPSVSALTSPIYPQPLSSTSPPPTNLQHSVSGPLSTVHHYPPYAVHGAYTPVGYATPHSYAYPAPASFVPGSSIYGSHNPPPHCSRPYSFPTGQESQGMWWYSPPGSTVAFNVLGGAQREFQPQPPAVYPPVEPLDSEPPDQQNSAPLPSEPQSTLRSTNRTRKGRSLNDAKQDVAMASSPTSPTNPRNQERRSYHPNPPAHRSEWVMWAGNVPSDVTEDELRDFFNQLPEDKEQIYGGVSTVFLISRSNCAFVNFDSQAQLEAATARFNGQSIRPDDQRCPRLVCRVRRREDDLMAGVGAQRGSGMHIKWVKEQRARVRREQADKVGSPKDMGHISTCPNLSRSPSIASTNSDILTRYFPQRYFILKSLTQSDLDRSVHKNIWATQRHNEEILDQAYRTSEDVFLIFSVNKSGEFFGYARMVGPVLRDESGTHWASATGFTPPPSSESSSSDISAGSSPSPDHTGAERQDSLYIFPLDEHRVKKAPQSAPAGRPSFPLIESHRPHYRLAHSMPNANMSPRLAAQASSSELRSEAPSHSVKDPPSTRRTSESVERDAVPGPHEVPEADIEDRPKPGSDVPFESRDTREDGTGSTWDRPFRVEWIRRDSLPFFCTRHIRNPWNHGREVKVSRDGTELEPTVGRLLLDEWDRSSVAVYNSPGPSRTPERRRGQQAKHQN